MVKDVVLGEKFVPYCSFARRPDESKAKQMPNKRTRNMNLNARET